MIRVLIMIAVVGFVLSLGSLSAAVAIGGPDAFTRGGWHWAEGGSWKGKHLGWDDDDGSIQQRDLGPQATRTLPWSGASRLDVDLAADIQYIQSAGPSSVVITGPEKAVNDVVISGDSLRYEHGARHGRRGYPTLTVVIRAPSISDFDLSGRNTLSIEGYNQPRLSIDVSGSAEVTATGTADEVTLDLSGAGDANLGALKSKSARVEVSGSADAIIAPSESAQLEISGSGDVRLLTNPKSLETEISGAGRVTQGAAAAPAAPAPPEPPRPPGGAKT